MTPHQARLKLLRALTRQELEDLSFSRHKRLMSRSDLVDEQMELWSPEVQGLIRALLEEASK